MLRQRFLLALLAAFCLSLGATAFAADPPPQSTGPDPANWTEDEMIQWYTDNIGEPPPEPGTDLSMNGFPSGFDQSNVTFFNGKRTDCKKLLGGLLSCCKKTVPDQQKQWWGDYSQMQKQNSAAQANDMIEQAQGSWARIQAGEHPTFADALQGAFTSPSENLQGGGSKDYGSMQTKDDQMGKMNEQFMNYENQTVKPSLGWYCDNSDFEVAVGKQIGECHYLGDTCQTKVLGVCIVKKQVYCCFNSPVTRMIREHFQDMGIAKMGTAKHPSCGGIPLDAMAGGNLDSLDTDEMIARMQEGGFLPDLSTVLNGDPADIESKYTGAESDFGDPSRELFSQRTTERLDNMDYQGSYADIAEDVNKTVPQDQTDAPTGPGPIGFNSGYIASNSGKPVVIQVSRGGGSGMVSVVFQTSGTGTAIAGTDYQAVSQTLYWGNGDISTQTVSIPTKKFSGASNKTFDVVLSSPSGGAAVNPYGTMHIELRPQD